MASDPKAHFSHRGIHSINIHVYQDDFESEPVHLIKMMLDTDPK